MTFYDRVVTVKVGQANQLGRQFSSLRIRFNVRKTQERTPNHCEVRVYNMSSASRAAMAETNNLMELAAGYLHEGGPQLLFKGDVLRVVDLKEGPDWVTLLESGDGAGSLREIRINAAYPENTQVKEVGSYIIGQLQLPVRTGEELLTGVYLNGFSFSGRAADALDRVCLKANLTWSVQNGEIVLVPRDQPMPAEAVVLSPQTGLIGVPEKLDDAGHRLKDDQEKPGWRVTSLLNPNIEPHGLVVLKSQTVSGTFRVKVVDHVGDNYSQEWYTILEVAEL